jgi:hypothetical protein
MAKAAPADRLPPVGTIQIALTVFLRDGGQGLPTLYFGGGFAFDVTDIFGFAGRGRCHKHTDHGESSMACRASATGVPLLPPDFFMDPLLQRGHVGFEDGRYNQTMEWENDEFPAADPTTRGHRVGFKAFTDARSSGRIFGYKYSERRDDPLSLLYESVDAYVAVNGMHIRTLPDGRVFLKATFPLDR